VKLNQDTATDVYIDRVSGSTFNGKEIYFTKGASDAQAIYNQSRRDHLLVFLKGSKKQKAVLKKEQSTLYSYFEEVWKVRNSHMVKGLPCYKHYCSHELCGKGKPEKDSLWYENGPPVRNIPFPIPDQKPPCGSEDCTECQSVCSAGISFPQKIIFNMWQNTEQETMEARSGQN